MQRDVKIGIVIGVLLIALIGIFWWARNDAPPQTPPRQDERIGAELPPPQEPIAPAGLNDDSPYLPESTPVAAAPSSGTTSPAAPPAGNPSATLHGTAAPPPEAPRPTPPLTTVDPAPPAARYHTVAKGETLSAIAKTYYGTTTKWRMIRDANRDKIPDPNRLKVGVKIVIPNVAAAPPTRLVPVNIGTTGTATVRKHKVAAGETLSSISKKYYGSEGKWRRIYDANRSALPSPNRLRQGMELVIPQDAN